MKRINIFSLAVIGLLLFSASCAKEAEKIEESFGLIFTVSGDDSWSAKTAEATKDGDHYIITATSDSKVLKMYIKDFTKGKYSFNDTLNHATYNNGSSEFASSITADSYVEITNIHSDGVHFDGKFNLAPLVDSSSNIKNLNGNWANATKK